MAIITISRGSFSGGKNLAECVAAKLGYRCLARVELIEAVRKYGVSEEELSKAISETPGLWERLMAERIRYLTCAQAALINEMKDEKVVYHGLAGHFLLQGVPHVLKVRVIANMEFRVKAAMEGGNMTRKDALQFIRKMDEKRARWTRFLYHVDWGDPSLYDLVINLDQVGLAGACDLVCDIANLEEYRANAASRKTMDDLVLGSHLKALIAADKSISNHDLEIEADGGVITLGGAVEIIEDVEKIERMVGQVPGVRRIDSNIRVKLGWGEVEGLKIR